MNWSDIASIVFVCVTVNHLGLISAVEKVLNIEKLPIIGCARCLSFWCVLAYLLVTTQDVIASLAVSFLASYSAVWLELIEGLVDVKYMKLYGKIITAYSNNTASATSESGNSECSVSELREDNSND